MSRWFTFIVIILFIVVASVLLAWVFEANGQMPPRVPSKGVIRTWSKDVNGKYRQHTHYRKDAYIPPKRVKAKKKFVSKKSTLTLKNVRIHIVDQKTINKKFPQFKGRAIGVASSTGDIYVTQDVTHNTLGHEIRHLLNYKYPNIISNPDRR